jgi:hypothetical protein
MPKWIVRIIGFVVAVTLCFVAAFLFFAILSEVTGHRYVPRGAGWLFGPLAAGFWGAMLAEMWVPKGLEFFKRPNGTLQYYLAGSVLWIAAVWAYVFIFDPFGSWWSRADWAFLWKLMLTPIGFAILCGIVLRLLRAKGSA